MYSNNMSNFKFCRHVSKIDTRARARIYIGIWWSKAKPFGFVFTGHNDKKDDVGSKLSNSDLFPVIEVFFHIFTIHD